LVRAACDVALNNRQTVNLVLLKAGLGAYPEMVPPKSRQGRKAELVTVEVLDSQKPSQEAVAIFITKQYAHFT